PVMVKEPLNSPSSFDRRFHEKAIQDGNRLSGLFDGFVAEIVGACPHMFLMSARGHNMYGIGLTSDSVSLSNGTCTPLWRHASLQKPVKVLNEDVGDLKPWTNRVS